MRLAACLEYDGSRFCGWQRQGDTPTVQGFVERALSQIADRAVRVVCAGRTDAGVHACAQTVHFDTQSERDERSWVRGTNTLLPDGIAVLWVVPVSVEFHARFSATGRGYRYVIHNRPVRPTYLHRRVGWEYRPLDEQRMREAAANLLGRHDFNAFRASACQARTSVRDLRRLEISRHGQWVCIDAEADAFLHHMVRNIVGVLLAVGSGEAEPSWAEKVLQSRDRTQAGVTAPPDGLYLSRVFYPEQFRLPAPPPICRFW